MASLEKFALERFHNTTASTFVGEWERLERRKRSTLFDRIWDTGGCENQLWEVVPVDDIGEDVSPEQNRAMQWDAFKKVVPQFPDAVYWRRHEPLVVFVEVEDTSPLTPFKLSQYCESSWVIDAYGISSELICTDRYGTPVLRSNLCVLSTYSSLAGMTADERKACGVAS